MPPPSEKEKTTHTLLVEIQFHKPIVVAEAINTLGEYLATCFSSKVTSWDIEEKIGGNPNE